MLLNPARVAISARPIKYLRHLSSFKIHSSESQSEKSPGLVVKSLDVGIVELQMSAPPVNTFTTEMLNNFRYTLEDLEANPKVKGLVLTSAVPNIYSAGLDLNEMHKPSRADFCRFWGTFEMAWVAFYMTPLATVSAIDGACPALGAVMALSSDYRVMVNNPKYRMGLNETQCVSCCFPLPLPLLLLLLFLFAPLTYPPPPPNLFFCLLLSFLFFCSSSTDWE
jgi:3,2-trans-enoyl-CoA isomerase